MGAVGRFLGLEASGGIVLLVVTLLTLVWANSPWHAAHWSLIHVPVGFVSDRVRFVQPLHFWVSDGLMTIFFFVVGLEIRREIHEGELSEVRRAALPVAGALGGMAIPAMLYAATATSNARRGWGIPTATDIAFAVGILTLLGSRVPAALRVFLLALAVIDDIGAIVVIALFYSQGIRLEGLGIAAVALLATFGMRAIRIRSPAVYVVPAAIVWAGFLRSGIHPTLAGVVLGLVTPVAKDARGNSVAERLVDALHPWVAFLIMPLFAFVNAGVRVADVDLRGAEEFRVALGVALGLFVGKPVGILAATFVATRLGFATLPRGIAWRSLLVAGVLAGIGFTMSIFIAMLAFDAPARVGAAKLAVLVGSAAAATVGLVVGRFVLPPPDEDVAALSDTDAERSTEF